MRALAKAIRYEAVFQRAFDLYVEFGGEFVERSDVVKYWTALVNAKRIIEDERESREPLPSGWASCISNESEPDYDE